MTDGDKLFNYLKKYIEGIVDDFIADAEEWADNNGMDVDLGYYETEDPEGAIKVGDEVFDISYEVVRKNLLEKPQST